MEENTESHPRFDDDDDKLKSKYPDNHQKINGLVNNKQSAPYIV